MTWFDKDQKEDYVEHNQKCNIHKTGEEKDPDAALEMKESNFGLCDVHYVLAPLCRKHAEEIVKKYSLEEYNSVKEIKKH